MDIINTIKKIDVGIFRFINGTLHNDLLASAMKFTANDVFVAAVVLGGLFLLARTGGKNTKTNMAFALWALIAANAACTVLKHAFKRPRPFTSLDGVYYLGELKRIGWSFPSTHTAMAAALAAVLWDDYRAARLPAALFVLFVGFFCVYTGGHYPSDVAAGFLIGIITGKTFDLLKGRYIQSQKSKFKSQK